MIQMLALLLQESAVKLTRWPRGAFFFFFNLDLFLLSFWEEERHPPPKKKVPKPAAAGAAKMVFFLICADFKGSVKECVIASLSGCWDGACLSGIIHLFDLGKERGRNKLKMPFPKGTKDVIHTGSLPPISGNCMQICV